jgi:hypothetical protein
MGCVDCTLKFVLSQDTVPDVVPSLAAQCPLHLSQDTVPDVGLSLAAHCWLLERDSFTIPATIKKYVL